MNNSSGNGGTPPSPFGSGRISVPPHHQGVNTPGGQPAAPPMQKTPSQEPATRPGGTRGQGIAQLAQSIGSLELSNQDDLHAFCEAYRAVLNYLAVSAKLAEGPLKAAARANARQARNGRLTPAQWARLKLTLGMVCRDLDALAASCAEGAAAAIKAWRRFEAFLDELESDSNGKHPGGRGSGFTVV